MKRCLIALLLLALVILPVSQAALAEETASYVTDTYGLLTQDQWQALEAKARQTAGEQEVGIYVLVVEDYWDYGAGDILDVAAQIYHDGGLGLGSGSDGVLLLMSMDDRDYALYVYGHQAQRAFNDYGQQLLEDAFLDDFGFDDWYEGFDDYLDACQALLRQAAAGEPVRRNMAGPIVITCLVCIAISALICFVIKGTMNTARVQRQADAYITAGGLQLTGRVDLFTHSTVVRRRIESSGGSSRGGGSGRSGKF